MPAIPGTLTGELARRRTPLREWFAAELPHCDAVYKTFRKTAPQECIEPPKGVPCGTLGAAFDYLIRYTIEPNYDAPLAVLGANFAQLESRSHTEAGRFDWPSIAVAAIQFLQAKSHSLSVAHRTDSELLIALVRRCWVLALFTEFVRGVSLDRSPLGKIDSELSARLSPDFSELMPNEVQGDIDALYRNVRGVLMPFIAKRTRTGAKVMGPDLGFHGLAADADLMVGTTLVEIKAVVGRRTRTGVPRYGLDARTLYQLVSYALLAIIAGYQVDKIAIFNARYAHLEEWNLPLVLTELAGRPVATAGVAAKFRAFIETNYG